MPGTREAVRERTDESIREPSRYIVVIHNDDVTTMDFVVMVLMHVFHKTLKNAQEIMLNVHENGKGICGVYPYNVAETKVAQVSSLSSSYNFPLRCTMEEE